MRRGGLWVALLAGLLGLARCDLAGVDQAASVFCFNHPEICNPDAGTPGDGGTDAGAADAGP